jgi:hypothetical protein
MDTDKTTDDEKCCMDVSGEEDQRTGRDLYVMQNLRLMGELKIGRSSNVELRRRSLQSSQNFTIDVLAIFPGAGYLEPLAHKILSNCRVTTGVAGREWFRCGTETALGAISLALGVSNERAVTHF